MILIIGFVLPFVLAGIMMIAWYKIISEKTFWIPMLFVVPGTIIGLLVHPFNPWPVLNVREDWIVIAYVTQWGGLFIPFFLLLIRKFGRNCEFEEK